MITTRESVIDSPRFQKCYLPRYPTPLELPWLTSKALGWAHKCWRAQTTINWARERQVKMEMTRDKVKLVKSTFIHPNHLSCEEMRVSSNPTNLSSNMCILVQWYMNQIEYPSLQISWLHKSTQANKASIFKSSERIPICLKLVCNCILYLFFNHKYNYALLFLFSMTLVPWF